MFKKKKKTTAKKKVPKKLSRKKHFSTEAAAQVAAKRRGKNVYKIPKVGWYVGTEKEALRSYNFANNVKSKRSLAADKKRKALPPGKRISKNGGVYYEYRQNRTDGGRGKI